MYTKNGIKLEWNPRPEQEEILEGYKEALKSNSRYYLVDAPTGTGKSFSALMCAKEFIKSRGGRAKVDILTNSKMLQSQYLRDFPFLSELKGKSNYPCSTYGCSCQEGAELAKANNTLCESCPHKMAFDNYITSEASMMNFHIYASFAMFVPHILKQREASMLIIDEAHTFEEVFSDFIAVVISKRSLELTGLASNPVVVEGLQSVESIEDFEKFWESTMKKRAFEHLRDLHTQIAEAKNPKQQVKIMRLADSTERFIQRISSFVQDEDRDSWLFIKEQDSEDKEGIIPHIRMEPVWAKEYLYNMLWKNYDSVVFMSGTILDPEIFCHLNGITDSVTYCAVDSPFPVDNRPIHYMPIGKMSYKYKDETIKKMIPAIKKILNKNSNVKGIIHTGSYANARAIRQGIRDSRLIFHDSGDAGFALKRHENSEEPTVLVSPSMSHGVDLKDDLSRLQITMKIPFPSLADKKIKRRLRGSQRWYSWKTWTDVVQGYGRSVRNKDDWAVTYILDSSFDQLLRSKHMMPPYFEEALVR